MKTHGELELPEDPDFWSKLDATIQYHLHNDFIPANEEDAWYDFSFNMIPYNLNIWLDLETEDDPNGYTIRATLYRDHIDKEGYYVTDTSTYAGVEV